MLIGFGSLLEGGEGSEVCAEVPVADGFEVLDGVFVVAAFPEPLGFVEFLVGTTGGVEGWEVADFKGECPWCLGPCDGVICGFPGPHVGHAHVAFFLDHELGSSEGADGAVAGAIAEEGSLEASESAGCGIDRGDGLDAGVLGVNLEGEVVEVEVEILFGSGDLFLELVGEFFVEAGGVSGEVGEFIDDFAEIGIFAALGSAHGPDVDFGGAVPAEDGSVVN